VGEEDLKQLRWVFKDLLESPEGEELEDDDKIQFWLSVAEIKALLRLMEEKEHE